MLYILTNVLEQDYASNNDFNSDLNNISKMA